MRERFPRYQQQQQQQQGHYQQHYGDQPVHRQAPPRGPLAPTAHQQQQLLQQQQLQQPYTSAAPYPQQQQQTFLMSPPDADLPPVVVADSNNSESSPAVVVDDADAAAGKTPSSPAAHPPTAVLDSHIRNAVTAAVATQQSSQAPPPPPSTYFLPKSGSKVALAPRSSTSLASLHNGSTSANNTVYPSDLEFFEDLVSEPVLVLGVDISHLDRNSQFLVCAAGVFGFSLLYGYLQELISVRLCGRQLGLFLAMVQFTGYTILAFVLRNFVYAKQQRQLKGKKNKRTHRSAVKKSDDDDENNVMDRLMLKQGNDDSPQRASLAATTAVTVPLLLYLGLSILRAIDLGMTNLAMQYINYPAKTLMKSSRVVFTMLFGVVISRKKYKLYDYAIVLAMVAGLALFMHADANSSAVFDLVGVLMLTVSLLCDGAISNVSETIMSKFGVGQDEFIFRMYSIALVAITLAAMVKGDFTSGFAWLLQPGTYEELDLPVEQRTWSVAGKITVMILFSSMGFFGSSCSAAITKNFGALTMSITSTARKAATLFLSFFLFNNVCTFEHILGVIVFIAALTAKSLRRSRGGRKSSRRQQLQMRQRQMRQNKRRGSFGGGESSAASSVVSDISDLELAPCSSVIEETSIPTVVHTEKLRSRQVAASPQRPAERHALVSTL